ncbi:MAG: rRNA maturation RNase YbeY [bacterium]|nr:rRNA maturation RNase YbeY [bacterium]
MNERTADNFSMDKLPIVSVSILENASREFQDERSLETVLSHALGRILSELGLFSDPEKTELEVSIVDDRKIQGLNLIFRNLDEPTDVLSFPVYVRGEMPGKLAENDPPRGIGDIVISSETIFRQAEERGIDFLERFTECFIHGVLHLFGYEHGKDKDRLEMEELEDRLFESVLEIIS